MHMPGIALGCSPRCLHLWWGHTLRGQDTFGPIEVPSDRYWGAQTQRSLTNFKIGGDDCTMPIEVL